LVRRGENGSIESTLNFLTFYFLLISPFYAKLKNFSTKKIDWARSSDFSLLYKPLKGELLSQNRFFSNLILSKNQPRGMERQTLVCYYNTLKCVVPARADFSNLKPRFGEIIIFITKTLF